MIDIRVFMVAIAGTTFTEVLQPSPLMATPGESLNEMLIRTLISMTGGILSTLIYKLINNKPLRRRLSRRRKRRGEIINQ